MAERVDLAVVGGGIVGLTTARAYARADRSLTIALLEKEAMVGTHQTGHNSGVVHSGVYYAPGSRKARLCLTGRAKLLAYAEARGLSYRVVGKLIVARDAADLPYLDEIGRRATANGVNGVRSLDPQGIAAVEPEVRGLAALHVPSAAIIDFGAVARAMADDLRADGHTVRTSTPVDAIEPRAECLGVRSRSSGYEIEARYLVNCAGLYADELARRAGEAVADRIVPFRGEFFSVRPQRRDLVRGLVYPVPDPKVPFLGLHFTPTVDGRLLVGPNAVLALAREGYSWDRIRLRELASVLGYGGFWRMLARQRASVVREALRSLDRERFVSDLQRLVPSLRSEDLEPSPSGVRAQAVSPDGNLREDFLWIEGPQALHVVNAPSPAATSSMAIAEEIVARFPVRHAP